MRHNQRIAEQVGRRIKSAGGSVVRFGDSLVEGSVPDPGAFIAAFGEGPCEVGVIVERKEKSGTLIFRWKARRG